MRSHQRRLVSLFFFIALRAMNAQHFTGAVDKGVIDDSTVDESSGVCASHQNANILWTHNDSGDKPRIFALNTSAHVVGTYYLKNADNRDWEDICLGRIDGVDYLFIGEIGDNSAQYPTKSIYMIREPVVSSTQTPTTDTLRGVETIRFEYPDGPRDAETLMFDAQTRDLYVLSKREDSVRLYQLPYPQSTTALITAVHVATLAYTSITAGDISPDGSEILIKDYNRIYYFTRAAGQSVADALRGAATQEPYQQEPQGEGICFDALSTGYYTTSEKSPLVLPAHLYFHPRVASGVASDTVNPPIRIDSVKVDASGREIEVTLTVADDAFVTVQLCDLRGKSILSTPHQNYRSGTHEVRLQTHGLSAGQYTVHVVSSKGMASHSFTVAH